MRRVAQYQADMAMDVLAAAHDAGDALVIAACRRVRAAWLLGHEVARADLELVETFARD